jgi:hypothetical protein
MNMTQNFNSFFGGAGGAGVLGFEHKAFTACTLHFLMFKNTITSKAREEAGWRKRDGKQHFSESILLHRFDFGITYTFCMFKI